MVFFYVTLFSYNAAISGISCVGRLCDKMGGTTIHTNGQRVKCPSAWPCYAVRLYAHDAHATPMRTAHQN